MSKRIDRTWVVFTRIENDHHDRCVDVFFRPDGSFRFEEFRRDVEDAGEWTPTQFFSGMRYERADLVYIAAEKTVQWLADLLKAKPQLRRLPH